MPAGTGAHDHRDVVILDRSGQIVADFEIKHSAPGWQRWREQVAALGPGVAVCVETSQGLVIEHLLESGVSLYPVSPVSTKAYRARKAPSGNKTDRLDAWSLADALRVNGQSWKALAKEDPLVAELRLLCRDEVALIEERTALVNQLQSALQEYYPAALEAFEDWTLPAAWAFLEAFPSPQALTAAGKRKWEKFLHSHKLARPQTYSKRLEIFARASQFASSEVLTRTKSRLALARTRMLRVLHNQIEAYRAEIEKLFAQHPDHHLFGSLPGGGPKIAPRLLGEIGSDRARFDHFSALQCLAGTASVSYQIPKVSLRRHCNQSLRSAVHLWTNLTRNALRGQRAITERFRARGKSHACALRCLGQRWLKILWKMW
jgi:transposase